MLQYRGVLLIWISVGQWPNAFAVGAARGYWDILSVVYHLFFRSGDGPIKTEILSQRAIKPKTTNQKERRKQEEKSGRHAVS